MLPKYVSSTSTLRGLSSAAIRCSLHLPQHPTVLSQMANSLLAIPKYAHLNMDLPQNDLKDQTINAPVLDWSTTPLSRAYAGYYVKIVDNVFADEECTALIKLAESDAEWKQAAVHYGLRPDQNYVDTEYRNSERILRFDRDAAEKLYQKLLPYVQELVEIKKGGKWDKIVGTRNNGTWTMVGCVCVFRLFLRPD